MQTGSASTASASKSGPLIYTPNFVYNVADCIGKGATASVFLARSTEHGQQVAIKVFDVSRHITSARLRETQLLQGLEHRNIMKLLACERESETGRDVIVLEYCQGGSVYGLLDSPSNAFGFSEKDFLIFLRDISEGLKYLRDKGIIHRDIKPGNILKKIDEDGSPAFVLTDFGAARQLEDEETFCSIYGTEEYIHPAMFQRGVLRLPGASEFSSEVDLWSLGVTLYHVSCGHLPWSAFDGRSDSKKLYEIITNRGSGDISGRQRSHNGPVERSKDLPECTNISRSLKNLLKPILAGLFEIDQTKAWTFEQYYTNVKDIIDRKSINVFYSDTSSNLCIYLKTSNCYVHLQETIASLTDISADRQLLLFGNTEFSQICAANLQVQSYPKSVLNGQLFLYEKDISEAKRAIVAKLPAFPSFVFKTSLSNDASVTRSCSGVAYFIEAKTSELLDNQRLALNALLNLRHYVQKEVKSADVLVPQIESQLLATQKRVKSIEHSQTNVQSISEMLDFMAKNKGLRSDVEQFCASDANLQDVLAKTTNRCTEITVYLSVLMQKLTELCMPGAVDQMGCSEQDKCLTKINHLRQGIQTVASTFSKHKKYGDLHLHEKFIHEVEREKFENLCVKMVTLYNDHCGDNMRRLHHNVQKQNCLLLKHHTRVGKVESNIACVLDCLAQINKKIQKVDEAYEELTIKLNEQVKSVLASPFSLPQSAPCEHVDQFRSAPAPRWEAGSMAPPSNVKAASAPVSDKMVERAELNKRLTSRVTDLRNAYTEIDNKITMSTASLRGLLDKHPVLDPGSFQQDRSSIYARQLATVNETVESRGITKPPVLRGETDILYPPVLNSKLDSHSNLRPQPSNPLTPLRPVTISEPEVTSRASNLSANAPMKQSNLKMHVQTNESSRVADIGFINVKQTDNSVTNNGSNSCTTRDTAIGLDSGVNTMFAPTQFDVTSNIKDSDETTQDIEVTLPNPNFTTAGFGTTCTAVQNVDHERLSSGSSQG